MAGTLCAVVGTYLCLVVLVLASRMPWLERELGHDGMLALHRRLGPAALGLIAAHVLFSSAGFAWALGQRLVPGTWTLVRTGDLMVPAAAGSVLMAGAGVLCVPAVRARLRYETWWVTHLYLYLAVALSFGHQLTLSPVFAGGTRARVWWIALYVATGAALLAGRVLVPVSRSLRLGLRVERVVAEGPDVYSVYMTGRHLDRMRVEGGQFFQWRFLTRRRWWQAHPYSLSAAPDGRRLRITVKNLGDHSGSLRRLRPGTRALVEGPYGVFTARRRRTQHVVAIAAGIGITPVRAMLEELTPSTTVHLLYAMSDPATAPLLAELRELRDERGWTLTELTGPRREIDSALLLDLVPGLGDADVYVCGPARFSDETLDALRGAGVAREHLHTEVFAFGAAPPAGAARASRPMGAPVLRALAATGGTIAGLAVVLGYSPVDDRPTTTDLAARPVGLGSAAAAPTRIAPPAPPAPGRARHHKAAPSATPAPTATPWPTPTPTPAGSGSVVPSPRPTPRATPRPTPRPTATPKPVPTPKPVVDPVALREVDGPTVSFAWGDLQVAIKVAGSRVVDAWALTAPDGHSQLFTQQAIPTLRSETLAAQSADIASVSGASGTSSAWKQSLAAALAQAGL